MNPLWAFFFKDKIKTPFSVYRMSLAELLVLGAIFVGMGYGIKLGIDWILAFETAAKVTE